MDKLQRYMQAAHDTGCPRSQVENFLQAGYIATPKALEFHAAARIADTIEGQPQVAIGGARGGGKSHSTFAQVVHDDCQRIPSLKALFLRSVGKAARESFEDLIAKVCPQYRPGYKPGLSSLELPNGSRVLFGGFRSERDIDKYLGIEYDLITIEENNLLTHRKQQQMLGSLRTSKPDWKPRLYSTFNPGGVGHGWVKRTFIEPWRKDEQTDTRFIFATYKDNPFIDDGYRAYLNGLTGWLGRAWRDGDWDISAGQFFTNWRRDEVVKEFEPHYGMTYWLALDYGFQHYTAVYLMGKADGHIYVIDEWGERKTLPSQHAQGIRGMLQRHKVHSYDTFVAGSDVFAKRGETTIADQYAAHGFKLTAAQMDRINGAGEILKRLGDIDRGIQPTLTIHPRCVRLIESIPQMQHDPHRPEDVLKVDVDEDGSGGDDFYDAFRYGVMEGAKTRTKARTIRYA